jgi:polyisoprenoid-binding protein YceI
MRIKFLFFALVISTLVWSCGSEKKEETKTETNPSALPDGTYKIDMTASTATWNASKVNGKHNGLIALKNGSFDVTGGKIVAGIFVFDVNSITVSDIPAEDENNAKLVGHLKSQDFFDAAGFPEARFMITDAQPNTDGTIQVTGDLEIKGHLEQGVSFPLSIAVENNNAKITGSVTFDRTKFDIKYNSKLLGTLPDKIIYDEVSLDLNLKASIQ